MRAMHFFRKFGVIALLLVASIPYASAAEKAPVQINERPLTQLFEAFLKKDRNDDYLEKRITEERDRIRGLINDELEGFLQENQTEEAAQQEENLGDALSRQRALVSALEERLRAHSVDLGLLQEEEKKYYAVQPASVEDEAFRLTKTYGQLLARKAILEERIAALNLFLDPQQRRLQRLVFQERIAQFSTFIGIATYVGILLAIVIAERLIRNRLLTRIQNRTRRYATMKVFTAFVYLAVIVWLLGRLFSEYPDIITSFAIVGAGLAVALQDVVKDVIGWLVIVQGKRFSLGQRISIGGITGDVIDIGLLRTTLLEVNTTGSADYERSGKTLYIPNLLALTQGVLNYNTTSDFIKAEYGVTITYESDWRRAEQILLAVLEEETAEYTERARRQSMQRTQQFYYSHELRGPVVYVDIGAHGVVCTMRFFVPIGERRLVNARIARKILERFAAETPPIEIAYNTSRVIPTPLDGVNRAGEGTVVDVQQRQS